MEHNKTEREIVDMRRPMMSAALQRKLGKPITLVQQLIQPLQPVNHVHAMVLVPLHTHNKMTNTNETYKFNQCTTTTHTTQIMGTIRWTPCVLIISYSRGVSVVCVCCTVFILYAYIHIHIMQALHEYIHLNFGSSVLRESRNRLGTDYNLIVVVSRGENKG